MAHPTRFHRRRIYRARAPRYAWRIIRKDHVRRALAALEALARRA
jgi:hypothetical protein